MVDSGGSIFIADTFYHRIIRWKPGQQNDVCIAGCTGMTGNRSDQLNGPRDVTFDCNGNLLVADTGNHRIQRFDRFIDPKCGEYNRQ